MSGLSGDDYTTLAISMKLSSKVSNTNVFMRALKSLLLLLPPRLNGKEKTCRISSHHQHMNEPYHTLTKVSCSMILDRFVLGFAEFRDNEIEVGVMGMYMCTAAQCYD